VAGWPSVAQVRGMAQVESRRDGPVGIITLSNPPHQFMTTAMVRELDALTARWEADPEVRAIIITGSGDGTFITHFSVDELARANRAVPDGELPGLVRLLLPGLIRRVDVAQHMVERLPVARKLFDACLRGAPGLGVLLPLLQIHRVFSRLERMDKPVIAAINGTAMGGGCELALACDYRLMARGDHVIGLVEVLGAIIPGAGGTQRMAATVGKARAVELLLDGSVLAPDEAERIGLISRAVDADALLDEALALAHRLATRSPSAVGHAKRAVRVGASLPLDDGLTFEKIAFVLVGISLDARTAGREYVALFRSGKSSRAIFADWRAGRR
jgi:enoyl-CoA hydratase